MSDQEQKLVATAQKLQAQVDSFRTKKETMKATYTAAEAQTKIGEAVSGISESMSDAGMSMQRAQDKIDGMQARAGAMDELISSGALTDLTNPVDDIQAQLDKASTQTSVDSQLAALKAEVGAGAPAAEVGSGTSASPAGEIGAGRQPRIRLVIVRILGEGQYSVPDGERANLEALDRELLAAVEARDEDAFAKSLAALTDAVRACRRSRARRRLRPVRPGRALRRRHPGRDRGAPVRLERTRNRRRVIAGPGAMTTGQARMGS